MNKKDAWIFSPLYNFSGIVDGNIRRLLRFAVREPGLAVRTQKSKTAHRAFGSFVAAPAAVVGRLSSVSLLSDPSR